MKVAFNKMKKLITVIISSILICAVLVSFSIVANATDEASSEITPAIQEIIDVIDTLPTNTDLITIEHKDAIAEIKTKYEKLSDDEKIAFPSDKYNIYSFAEIAITPFLLDSVATRIEALGKNIKAKDNEEVLDIYNDYLTLSETAQSALSKKNTDKLLAAVEKVNKSNETSSDKEIGISLELILIIVISCFVAVNIVLFVIVIIKLLCKTKERLDDEEESN